MAASQPNANDTGLKEVPKIRMTKQRRALLTKMQGGVRIIAEKTDFGGQYYALSDGSNVSQTVVEGLIPTGILKPVGDGLFGDTQSYQFADDFQ